MAVAVAGEGYESPIWREAAQPVKRPIVRELCLAGPVGSSDYTLGSLDKIRLKVFEWRASRDEIFEWTAFNAEYTVGAGGKISLPLIGDMAAAGKSPTELAQAIGQALRTRIGLAEPPSISVEVVQFRPFYIVGDVERPGEYAYRPGLTLLQAITIAGGMPRAKNLSPARLERESISTRGDLRLLEGDLVATMARKARLTSELQASDEIAIPDELNEGDCCSGHGNREHRYQHRAEEVRAVRGSQIVGGRGHILRLIPRYVLRR
jgi:protein involved in polysaccharide export with SLBB domain